MSNYWMRVELCWVEWRIDDIYCIEMSVKCQWMGKLSSIKNFAAIKLGFDEL